MCIGQVESSFREVTAPFAAQAASKWVGDCYLLAFAKESGATMTTFDRGLLQLARKNGCAAVVPG